MNKIIVMFEHEDKELNMSLYDFIKEQYRHAISTLVCHVTKEEYKIMLDQIKYGSLNERLPMVTREKFGYNMFRYLLFYDKICNNIHIANYENPEQKGNYIVDNGELHYNKNGIQFPKDRLLCGNIGFWNVKVYTTETYEDIISHYKSYQKSTQISLSDSEIRRFEVAYEHLSKSLKTADYSENDLKEFRVLFANILSKCDQ